MFTSLLQIANFIKTKKVEYGKTSDVTELQKFSKATYSLISAIYESSWDTLPIDKYNNSIRKFIVSKFTPKSPKIKVGLISCNFNGKAVKIIKLPLHPAYLPKKVLEKLKFFGKDKKFMTVTNTNSRKLYTQVTGSKVFDILKLKDGCLNLLAENIKNTYKIINNINKTKPQIKMTTRGLSCKQVIVPISKTNINNVMALLTNYD